MSICLMSTNPIPEILVVSQSRACIDGIASQAKKLGPWRLRFCRSRDQRLHALLENAHLKGAIVEAHKETIHTVMQAGIPVVSVMGENKRRACPSINFDEFAIGEMAAQHLLQRGFRKLTWSGVGHVFSRQREAGFRHAVDVAGGTVIGKRWTWMNSSADNIGNWLRQQKLPLGIACCSDNMADLVMSALEQEGIDVPQQAAVVGVDNNELICELSMQSISSVDRNEQQIGETAAHLLAQILKGKSVSREPITISPRFVVERKSSLIDSVGDPRLQIVMQYIRDNAQRTINIAQLIYLSGYSRATFFRKFQEQFHSSPNQLIRQQRLEKARGLLLDTDHNLTEIAIRCGLKSAAQLSKCFKQVYQQSPGAFRNLHIS